MCVVSFVGDHFNDRWKDQLTPFFPQGAGTGQSLQPINIGVSQQQFDDLKKEVELMKELLIKAKIYDEQNNEKDCEMEAKVKFLKQVAEAVGVDLTEVFGNKPAEGETK